MSTIMFKSLKIFFFVDMKQMTDSVLFQKKESIHFQKKMTVFTSTAYVWVPATAQLCDLSQVS